MNDNEASLAMFDQAKLKPEVRHAALATAHAILSREGITAAAALRAYGVDLLLAEGLEPEERTHEHFREHGASMKEAARRSGGAARHSLEPAGAFFGRSTLPPPLPMAETLSFDK